MTGLSLSVGLTFPQSLLQLPLKRLRPTYDCKIDDFATRFQTTLPLPGRSDVDVFASLTRKSSLHLRYRTRSHLVVVHRGSGATSTGSGTSEPDASVSREIRIYRQTHATYSDDAGSGIRKTALRLGISGFWIQRPCGLTRRPQRIICA